MSKLSVLLCTYEHLGRFSGIRKAVSALSMKSNDDFIYEIIIVDNGNSISHIEKKELAQLNRKIIFVIESAMGLSRARNAGVRTAQGDIVAFIDDDGWVDDGWARNILEVYKNGQVLCAGGEVKMLNIDMVKSKRWITDYFLRFLFPTKFPQETGPIAAPFYLIGANMSFRKNVFEKYGFFEERLGRISGKLLSCEDTEFVCRLPKESVFFVKNAIVCGKIDEKRLTRIYMMRRLFWQGYSDYIFIQKVGFSNFFDTDEIPFSMNFIAFCLSKTIHCRLFEFICAIFRMSGYYLSKIKTESR